MGEIRACKPALLLVAVFGVCEEALALAQEKCQEKFGKIALQSASYYFDSFTHYYAKEMGERLPKKFWVFEDLVDPGQLATIKRQTNLWEEEIGHTLFKQGLTTTNRPVNLDPGYIELGKLILASTKDHAHRIYLRDGIFAETTLFYRDKAWQALPWTYADYQDAKNQEFFTECRNLLKRKLQALAQN
ncbi:MAG: DUF4416 family protein [Planctomycetia bacterium]|nr:DUF4416 family protein [Planctomycetia bacterium]